MEIEKNNYGNFNKSINFNKHHAIRNNRFYQELNHHDIDDRRDTPFGESVNDFDIVFNDFNDNSVH